MMIGICGPTRNLTATFLKYRTEQKRKKNRFGAYSLLGTASDRVTQGDSASPHGAPGGATVVTPSSAAARHQHLLGDSPQSAGLSAGMPASETRIEMAQIQPKAATAVTLPPLWVDVVEDTQDAIARIKERLSALQKAQQRRLLKIFGDESQLTHPDIEIERMSDHITQLFRRAESSVKQIRGGGSAQENEAAEQKLRKNAQISLATQLQALSQQFRKQQKHFAAELRKRSGQADKDVTSGASADRTSSPVDLLSIDETSRRQQQQVLAQKQGFSESQVAELQHMEQDMDTRNEEVAHISRSVAEMHSIFKELAVLVIDQGTVLDRIDYNVEQVVDQTRQANVHIKKAEEYQKNSRATRVIIFLVVAILLLLLLFVWKHS